MTDINIGAISEALNNKADLNLNNTNPLARTVVEVSDKSLMPSWYRVYSDGWCEQGGQIGTITTVNFVKQFKDTNYIVLFGKVGIDSQPIVGQSSDYSTSSFYFTTAYNGSYTGYPRLYNWKACGYLQTTTDSSSSSDSNVAGGGGNDPDDLWD